MLNVRAMFRAKKRENMEFKLNEYRQGVTDQELLADVMRVVGLVGDQYLSYSLYKAKGKYSEATFRRRFGSWSAVLEKLGLRTEKTSQEMKRISKKSMIDDVKRVSQILSSEVVTTTEYKKHGNFALPTIGERFGSWSNFIQEAGLGQTNHVSRIDDSDLFKEIERIWVSLGKQPTTTDMQKGISKYSLDTFMRRFGGWRNALFAFIQYVNSADSEAELSKSVDQEPEEEVQERPGNPIRMKRVSRKRTSRNINLKMRFTVLQRDNFVCRSCGASPAKNPGVELHIDHIVPWSRAGETEIENLQTLCSKCNLGKSSHEFS